MDELRRKIRDLPTRLSLTRAGLAWHVLRGRPLVYRARLGSMPDGSPCLLYFEGAHGIAKESAFIGPTEPGPTAGVGLTL
jgi:hypothetical protein